MGLSIKSTNNIALGECGRLPLVTEYLLKCIKYWCKLLYMSDDRTPKNCYIMLKRLDDLGRRNWATNVKELLFKYGFGHAWIYQNLGDVNLFISIFKQRLHDIARQNWLSEINQSPKCCTYKEFKTLLNPERYLSLSIPFKFKKMYAKFRCSNHNYAIEIGRHNNIPRSERLCNHCLERLNTHVVEDEYHVMFICPRYDEPRNRLLLSWYKGSRNRINFINLMTSNNDLVLKQLCYYVYEIMK